MIDYLVGGVYPIGVVVGGLRTRDGVGGVTRYTDEDAEPGIW